MKQYILEVLEISNVSHSEEFLTERLLSVMQLGGQKTASRDPAPDTSAVSKYVVEKWDRERSRGVHELWRENKLEMPQQ